MARQGGVSTPIFDQLLREMTEARPPAQPPPAPGPGEPDHGAPGAPRRRHRAD
ncbi:MAG TPA: hypothetical protein VGX25_17820 [Actinophytocola sp.]|uniref:hypothetical protein n=1 Tax=Actinophytocola sp. TaxID=1872138 RepID=UPI002DDD6FCA|nr:hypothetical protein [Actinophytocola sp.]HEV2781243.1 hypothetical protein [Actinophytocola sp.]